MKENSCCGDGSSSLSPKSVLFYKETPAGKVPVVSTALTFSDIAGGWKARWGINRYGYKIDPGLYGTGDPDDNSPVLVSANYKFSFDMLRKELCGINAWILVIDTKGINVWCAAGKGTFGTKELIGRIINHSLASLVGRREIILPQLGAVGVSAHKVASFTKFRVIYGPVKAKDLPEFLSNGHNKTSGMKLIGFGFTDRLALVPMEIVSLLNLPVMLILSATILAFSLIEYRHLSLSFIQDMALVAGAFITGTAAVPLLLPWIPGRSFAWKGFLAGLFWTLLLTSAFSYPMIDAIFFILVLPPLSSFLALNFTGSTTYTSQSGVKKEMKYAVPYYFVSAGIGIILKFASFIAPKFGI